jgi:hypothetical protein
MPPNTCHLERRRASVARESKVERSRQLVHHKTAAGSSHDNFYPTTCHPELRPARLAELKNVRDRLRCRTAEAIQLLSNLASPLRKRSHSQQPSSYVMLLSMNQDEAIEKLNSVKYVYLRELSEPRDNSLRLVVEEAIVNRLGIVRPSSPELAEIMRDAWPIESIEGCKTFELYWRSYASYLVTEELLGSNAVGGYEDEVFSGKILRRYSKSHFLDHLARDTGGHLEPIQHYKLICLNHLIDVAAYAPPEIQVIGESVQSRIQ